MPYIYIIYIYKNACTRLCVYFKRDKDHSFYAREILFMSMEKEDWDWD